MATRSIPADWYTTTESLERDRAAVLRLGWQYIGSATDVAEAGSFTTGELGSLPIVITRDGDGTLRGFANVCRHRGALIAEGCGKRRTLQCRYHGWTYKLDGSLHRSPGMTLDEEVRLPEVAVATLGPLLFAAADPDCEPLETALAPFLELLDRVAAGEEIVITRHDKPVARIVREGAPRLDDVRRTVEALRSLQLRIAARGPARATLSDRDVRAAIDAGRL